MAKVLPSIIPWVSQSIKGKSLLALRFFNPKVRICNILSTLQTANNQLSLLSEPENGSTPERKLLHSPFQKPSAQFHDLKVGLEELQPMSLDQIVGLVKKFKECTLYLILLGAT